MSNFPSDLRSFIAMARGDDYLILDTETSGLKCPGEIVEIAIIDRLGATLLDTLIRPRNHYPDEVSRINGITLPMLEDKPYWSEVVEQIMTIVRDKNLVVYNATFDRSMFHCSDESNMLNHHSWSSWSQWYCAMTAYAEFRGDWDDYHASYTWQKLTNAALQCNIPPYNAHRALGDCLMTGLVVRTMVDRLADVDLLDIGTPTFNEDDE